MAWPCSSADSAENGLIVEAEGYWPLMARLSSGVFASAACSCSHSSVLMPPMKALGS